MWLFGKRLDFCVALTDLDRFDMWLSPTSYIQSRGRTKQENSVDVIFIPQDNIELQSRLNEYRILEQTLLEFCRTASEDRNVTRNFTYGEDEYLEGHSSDSDELDSDEEDNDFVENMYIVPTTGAVVTKNSAVSLVCRFCSALPSDSFCVLKPIFELFPAPGGFTCTLRLPNNSPVTEVSSEFSRSKNGAKRLAALAACQQLHSRGVFDDHLLPKVQSNEDTGEMMPELDTNGLVIGSSQRCCLYEKRTPKFWKRVVEDEEDNVGGHNEDGIQEEVTAKEQDAVETSEQVEERNAGAKEPSENEDIVVLAVAQSTKGQDKASPIVIPSTNDHDTFIPDNTLPAASSSEGSSLTEKGCISTASHHLTDNSDLSDAAVNTSKPAVMNGPAHPTALIDSNGDVIEQDNKAGDAMDETREEASEEQKAVEELDEEPFVVWMSVIDVELEGGMLDNIPVRRLCLFTWREFLTLPTFELSVRGTPIQVTVRPLQHSFSFDKEKIQLLADFSLKMASSITNKEYTCAVRDFPYFLAPLKRGCETQAAGFSSPEICLENIDWEEMSRGVNNKTIPLQFDQPDAFDDTILIDYTDSSRRYFVKAVCNDLSPASPVPDVENIREAGYESFAAYYNAMYNIEVQHPDQPMVQVSKINKVMNYLKSTVDMEAKQKSRTATYVIPEFCTRFPISASVYQAVMMIPSIMTRLDSFLLVLEARQRYDLPIQESMMLEAFTTPSANMTMDYERLETLGDSLLKFIATIRLFINFPFDDEGELHYLRIRVICNKALYKAAKKLKIFRYVTSQAFNRRHWRPHHFVAKSDTPDTLKETKRHMLSDKTLADIVEALLGAAYLSSGLEGGLHCAIQMMVPFDDIQTWGDFQPTYAQSRSKVPPRAEISALRKLDISRIEEISGYHFKTPLLVVEALTHASLPNSSVPCYQRLEFLGDAILDFLVIRYLFKKYPKAPPRLITDLKGACVNNHVLGIVCLEVELHSQIIHYSGDL